MKKLAQIGRETVLTELKITKNESHFNMIT